MLVSTRFCATLAAWAGDATVKGASPSTVAAVTMLSLVLIGMSLPFGRYLVWA